MPSEVAMCHDDYRARLRYGESTPLPLIGLEVAEYRRESAIVWALKKLAGVFVSFFVTGFALFFIWYAMVHFAALTAMH